MTAQERPVSKPSSEAYRDNWEKIFGKKSGNTADIPVGDDDPYGMDNFFYFSISSED